MGPGPDPPPLVQAPPDPMPLGPTIMAQLLTAGASAAPAADPAAAVPLPPGGLPLPGAGVPGAAGLPGMGM